MMYENISVGRRPGLMLASTVLALAACSSGGRTVAAKSSASQPASGNRTPTPAATDLAPPGSYGGSEQLGDIPVINPYICASSSTGPVKTDDGQPGYCEEAQATGGVTLLEHYQNASGVKARLEVGSTVIVKCVAFGPAAAAPSAASDRHHPGQAEWYDIIAPPQAVGYAASNAFWNVTHHAIPFQQQPTFDPRVPFCGK